VRPWLPVLLAVALCASRLVAADPAFRAGAAAVDVTPEKFPVAVNCGFVEQTGKAAQDTLHARAVVLDDGTTRLAIVVVDNCMMPREFLDRTKELVRDETRIPTDRQLISATHTHSAPAVMGCLGSDPDPAYAEFLQRQIVRAVRLAAENLVPAKTGWAVASAEGLTHNRQWLLRTDKVRTDPFGGKTVRSNMHPGYQHPDFVGPSGPTDPWLSVLAFQTADGKPLAVLANFSMHYFGAAPVSADYFGKFCAKLEHRIGKAGTNPAFVAIMSQGTAGDLHWMDYGKPKPDTTIETYSDTVADVAYKAWEAIRYRPDVPLAMAETTLTLDRRVPGPDRLEWAKKRVEALGGKKPTDQPDIYAREAVFLHDDPKREPKLQAIRVGEVGIAAIPNEVFALTGLKLKARSPLRPTFTVELANGAEGYIPPPEQHTLGGYTTWPARTAGLEVQAEPKIFESVIKLLEQVSGKRRLRDPDPAADPYAKAVLADGPLGYWRLGELAGPKAFDVAGGNHGSYEPGVVFGLDGPLPRRFAEQAAVNRSAHFAGGRMAAKVPALGGRYSVELWFWNGVPPDARTDLGVVVALGIPGKDGKGGQATDEVFLPGKGPGAEGRFRTWNHVLYVRDRGRTVLYLNGEEASGTRKPEPPPAVKPTHLFVGGSADGKRLFEGRVAEVAVYDRALSADEAKTRVAAAK
jgi:hypothetical protein